MKFLERRVLGSCPLTLLLLGSSLGRHRLTEVQTIHQVGRLSVRRCELDGKPCEIVLLEYAVVEAEGEKNIAVSSVSCNRQSIIRHAISGSRGHNNLLEQLCARNHEDSFCRIDGA
jgi:hypothetical protein